MELSFRPQTSCSRFLMLAKGGDQRIPCKQQNYFRKGATNFTCTALCITVADHIIGKGSVLSTYTILFCPCCMTCRRRLPQNADLSTLSFILSIIEAWNSCLSSGGAESMTKSMSLQNFSSCSSYLHIHILILPRSFKVAKILHRKDRALNI